MLDKLKSVNKWVWIALAAVIVAAAVVLVLVLSPGDKAPEGEETGSTTTVTTTTATTTGESGGTTTVAGDTTTVGGDTTTTEAGDTTTTVEGETTTSTDGDEAGGTTTTTDQAFSNDTGTTTLRPTGPDTTVADTLPTSSNTSNNTTTATEPTPTVTNPDGEEILGAGSKDQPYLEYPGEDMTVHTVEVPAGKSLYYEIYRVGGMILTIDSPNAYVVYEGKRYNATGGKVTVEIETALASAPILFEIGNSGSAPASFTLKFENPRGSYMSPVEVTKLEKQEISLPAGAEAGYYYRYVAEKDGTLHLYITANKDSILLATNNRNSAQRTSEADSLTDAEGNEYVPLEVQKGDEILINVGAKPNARGKYQAVDITWWAVYA